MHFLEIEGSQKYKHDRNIYKYIYMWGCIIIIVTTTYYIHKWFTTENYRKAIIYKYTKEGEKRNETYIMAQGMIIIIIIFIVRHVTWDMTNSLLVFIIHII